MSNTNKSRPVDPIVELMNAYNSDQRVDKINLGIGVYQDENGAVPIFSAVKSAEKKLLETQMTKTYVGVGGDPEFVKLITNKVFGETAKNFSGIQTIGGSGALRVIGDAIREGWGASTIWVSNPTWPNHHALFEACGHTMKSYEYPLYDDVDIVDNLIASLSEAKAGDFIIFHACCHNPTGIDLSDDQWTQLTTFCASKGIIPIFDAAYIGFHSGFDSDAQKLARACQGFDFGFCAFSCSKNFGLYRERAGAALVYSNEDSQKEQIKASFLTIARASYSMPPDHGAAIVAGILDNDEMASSWIDELEQARVRINSLRVLLATHLENLSFPFSVEYLKNGHGLFALLPLSPEQTYWLRSDAGIYMMPSGRINIAGINTDNVSRLAEKCVSACNI